MKRGRRPAGKLIVFEGPDGVGKSTLSAAVAERLNREGNVCALMTFPGREKGTLGELIYDLHHDLSRFGVNSLTPLSRQCLHIAAHLDAIQSRIMPVLASGRHVLLDRFWWSTWVYGVVGEVDVRVLRKLIHAERMLWGKVLPLVSILVKRDAPFNQQQPDATWKKLVAEYERLANQEKLRYPVVTLPNEGGVEESVSKILSVLSKYSIQPSMRSIKARGSRADQVRGTASAGMAVLNHVLPAKPTPVFDTYWRFAVERQNIFFRRLSGEPPPWTSDPILAAFKFTNAYRASDRVSQYLIRRVIYREDLSKSHQEVFFRILLFKVFNKIETWELLEQTVGPITFKNYSFEQYDKALTIAMGNGSAIYSAAYIMPSGGRGAGERKKHRMHLRLIEKMMIEELPKRVADCKRMHLVFDLLRNYPTIGDFLAYQYATDINYSEITNFSEMDFVVPGPGALNGIRKCFADYGGLNESEIIKFMADHQLREFDRLGLKFSSLWGRRLQLIDCQNLFCEVDKYARVAHPDILGVTARTRIKQRFVCNRESIQYWYPPKWGINHLIDSGGPDDSNLSRTDRRRSVVESGTLFS